MKGSEVDRHGNDGMNCAEATVAEKEFVEPLALDGIYRLHAPDVAHWIRRRDFASPTYGYFMPFQRAG